MTNLTQTDSATAVELNVIVEMLDAPHGVLPVEAIEACRQHRDEIIPLLIEHIVRVTKETEEGEPPELNGHIIALSLLGEFRETKALPAIIKAISLPNDGAYKLFGDALYEMTPSVLAAIAGDRLDDIVSLLYDNKLKQSIRWTAAGVLVKMVAAGVRPRDEIMEILRAALRAAIDNEDVDLANSVVNEICDLYPEEAYDEIKKAFARRLIDESVITLECVDRELQEGREAALARLTKTPVLIDDTVKELQPWACFQKKEKPKRRNYSLPLPSQPRKKSRKRRSTYTTYSQPSVGKPVRGGRNQPCPCGSGKKYKKCCGAPGKR